MSRLTGADAYGLMEAYQAVYAPQELTEEQVWEEVENWVNSLVEEGYDLSDYTWEEMYESYLEEREGIFNNDITRGIGNYARSLVRNPQNNTAANSGQFGRYVPGSQQVKTPTAKPDPKPDPKPAAPAPAAARPSGGAPRPSAGAPAKVAPKPALGSTGKPLVGGIERRTPTRAEMGAAKAYRTPAATTGTLGAATAAASKPAAFGSTATAPEVKATNTAAAKTTPTPVAPKQTPRQARLNMEMEYDAYDTVLEYLVSEGYADTEEAALVIMANMSEEWREEILDEGFKKMNRGRIERQAKKLGGDKGITLRALSSNLDSEDWRKHSTSQARKNRAGGSGSEYRKGKELQARDDAQADIKKYGLR